MVMLNIPENDIRRNLIVGSPRHEMQGILEVYFSGNSMFTMLHE